jgi:predicted transcriptional regulator
MDISAQIKESLIMRIQNSENLNFLKALQTMFDASEESLFELSTEQQKSIQTGRRQIKNGEFHSNENVISELKEWLSKK